MSGAHSQLPQNLMSALRVVIEHLPLQKINWALTGSAAHMLQGIPLEVHDIDIQTDEASAWRAAQALSAYRVSDLEQRESDVLRSLLAQFSIHGTTVELFGRLQKRLADGSWGPPTDPSDHRRYVKADDLLVPVLDLEYEALAYEQIGRPERAALLRRHGGDPLR